MNSSPMLVGLAALGPPYTGLRRSDERNGLSPCLLVPALLVLICLPAPAAAGDFIPVPSFNRYEIPQTQNPAPLPEWREWLDVAALAVGLGLASWLALVRRSRRGLFLLAIVSLAWLGFWRKGCICPIGTIQNVALALGDPTYAMPAAAVAIFALPLVFTLLFGRTFCAAVCPLGAMQELVAVRPQKVPLWLDHALGLLPFVYLGAAVALAATDTAFLICRYDPFVSLFRLSGDVHMLILGGCFLAVGMFVGRPYCRWLCPYGAILGLASRVARRHVQIPPEECIRCRLCEDACPYNAIREPTVVPAADQRRAGRRRVGVAIVLLPLWIAAGGLLGSKLGPSLARLHPTVRLAESLRGEPPAGARNDAAEAFLAGGRSTESLGEEADAIVHRLDRAGTWFGVWVGFVVGCKWIQLSVRRRRVDYQPDRSNCVSCGRCFSYCPAELAQSGVVK